MHVKESRRMRKVLIQKDMIFDVHHYFVSDELDSPYYKVFQDGDTESVGFVNPKWGSRGLAWLY
jgi:hypothetical protein